MKTYSVLVLFFFFLFGCASGHCGRGGRIVKMSNLKEKVFIYKYDNSKQCEKETGIDIGDMAKELKGMKIFSMFNKNDGQHRIQVCGALTGYANIYEIHAKDLAKAEGLGFKKWTF